MNGSAVTEPEFLRKVQRLLAEGDFSATYKLALLNALADFSIEGELAPDGSLRVPIDAIAAKFIEYYWRQARPYRPLDGAGFVLRQNAGHQAVVINAVTSLQATHPTLATARRSSAYGRALRSVAENVEAMPLWKLQRIGGDSDEFLYRRSEYIDRSIRLLPGVPVGFRALHRLVLDAVRGAWVRRILQIRENRRLLESADISSFLFGTERSALTDFAGVLREHQHAQCLYCGHTIRSGGAVDHFIAWSRYPADLGHNLVLAHPACNGRKRDFLAHPRHVESWCSSHLERSGELAERFDAAKLPHDIERTRAVALVGLRAGRARRRACVDREGSACATRFELARGDGDGGALESRGGARRLRTVGAASVSHYYTLIAEIPRAFV